MKDKTILRCVMNAIGRIAGSFSSTGQAARYNPVLAKWEQHYDARPNGFARDGRHGSLHYFMWAD